MAPFKKLFGATQILGFHVVIYCDLPWSGHVTDSRDLTKVAVAGRMSGNQITGLGILEYNFRVFF